jgi:hypothetical protein
MGVMDRETEHIMKAMGVLPDDDKARVLERIAQEITFIREKYGARDGRCKKGGMIDGLVLAQAIVEEELG